LRLGERGRNNPFFWKGNHCSENKGEKRKGSAMRRGEKMEVRRRKEKTEKSKKKSRDGDVPFRKKKNFALAK